MTEREQYLGQIDKLVNSHVCMAPSLCANSCAISQSTSSIIPEPRSRNIRLRQRFLAGPTDFDPQLDSMVRVQAGRLRVKLAEYYGSDGAEDPVVVELPKGTYVALVSSPGRRSTESARFCNCRDRSRVAHRPGEIGSSPQVCWPLLLVISLVAILGMVSNRNPPKPGFLATPTACPRHFGFSGRLCLRPGRTLGDLQ